MTGQPQVIAQRFSIGTAARSGAPRSGVDVAHADVETAGGELTPPSQIAGGGGSAGVAPASGTARVQPAPGSDLPCPQSPVKLMNKLLPELLLGVLPWSIPHWPVTT